MSNAAREQHSSPSTLMRAFADPASFAMVGASEHPAKWGHRILYHVIAGGYQGRVYPVNPKGGEILGLKVWPSVASLPEIPEVVFVSVPASAAAAAVEEAALAGARAFVVITAGFAEAGDDEAEEELARVARAHRLAMVGPNSMGFMSARARLRATMSGSAPRDGGISFVSQSGNVGSQAMTRAYLHGAGFSLFFSMGNGAALDSADYLDFLSGDEGTRVIALYLEGIREADRFVESLTRAARVKPVIITKGGRTAAGASAARSHTAALATPDDLFRGVVRQTGAVLTDSIEWMMDLATALDLAPLPRGRRVGILTWGGGWGVLGADACAAAGLELPPLSAETVAAIDELLPPYWSRGNPVDLVGGLDHEAHLRILEIMTRADEFDSLLVLGLLSTDDPREPGSEDLGLAVTRMWGVETAEAMIRLTAETGKPLIGVTMSAGIAPPPEADDKLPVYHTPARAVRVLSGLVELARQRDREPETPQDFTVDRARAEALTREAGTLSEQESLELLAAYGIPTVSHALVVSEEEGATAARRLGFPVVLKASGRGIAHKTERGLVAVHLRDEEQFASAWRAIQYALAPGEGGGMLVEPMVRSRREFAVGVVRDGTFGPCVMFGLGGVYAEALRDVAFRHAPLSRADALEMMEEVRAGALLGALRGEGPVDRDALADLLVRLGRLAVDVPRITEIDVNPVLVPDGLPLAADALVVVG